MSRRGRSPGRQDKPSVRRSCVSVLFSHHCQDAERARERVRKRRLASQAHPERDAAPKVSKWDQAPAGFEGYVFLLPLAVLVAVCCRCYGLLSWRPLLSVAVSNYIHRADKNAAINKVALVEAASSRVVRGRWAGQRAFQHRCFGFVEAVVTRP